MTHHFISLCLTIACALTLLSCSSVLEAEDLDVKWGGVVSWQDVEGNSYEIELSTCKVSTIEIGINDPQASYRFQSTARCQDFAIVAIYDAEGQHRTGKDSKKSQKFFLT